ncbi:MAG: DUF4845 domain-containing protein [Xanthomonadales bacterium]|nr:DUF4845 domain-containing protein [Xanthomonadales bacterium]
MRNIKRQKGITLISLILILGLLGFAFFIGMKLFPVYQEYYSVVQAMKNVAAQPGINRQEAGQIKEMLIKRFYTSYVDSVTKKHIKVSRNRGYTLQIKYEVRKPLIGNIDFVAKFDKSVELAG